jgi:hypothetical protein
MPPSRQRTADGSPAPRSRAPLGDGARPSRRGRRSAASRSPSFVTRSSDRGRCPERREAPGDPVNPAMLAEVRREVRARADGAKWGSVRSHARRGPAPRMRNARHDSGVASRRRDRTGQCSFWAVTPVRFAAILRRTSSENEHCPHGSHHTCSTDHEDLFHRSRLPVGPVFGGTGRLAVHLGARGAALRAP